MGLSFREFWGLTLGEFLVLERAWTWRARRAVEDDVRRAWLSAYMAAQRTLEPPQHYMQKLLPWHRRVHRVGYQSAEEMRAIVAGINQALGGTVNGRKGGARD